MNRSELVNFLDNYLQIGEIEDYGPQGLQVEADQAEIGRVALSVDASPQIIEAAAAWQTDMLLVHHGILWRSVEPIAGPLGRRVRLLLANQVNLYAAHLALDAHPEVGNNAVLAKMLGVEVQDWWCPQGGVMIGVCGPVAPGTTLEALVSRAEAGLKTTARVLAHGPAEVSRVAIVSGFGADEVGAAKVLGADTFLTGETSHSHYWAAADHGLNVIFAGHYATETVGVRALGQRLAERFGLATRFLDFPTGM
ncbi:MAG: Nif3-like dinuclear metal center hexameric protein [Chloroflexota bacterium]|nr:MAG: Nif3-like dinuclear metal center hexameric protein [Chloroflexota bacterium]